jgi:hypothetical protein
MLNPLLTTNHLRTRLVLPAVVAVTALAGSAPAMATPIPAAPGPTPTVGSAGATAQGIIMRDGGICDPIRHIGC